jgi:hypothetical protein
MSAKITYRKIFLIVNKNYKIARLQDYKIVWMPAGGEVSPRGGHECRE